MISILLALALAGQPAAAQAPAPAVPRITAEVVAGAIRERLPQRFSPELAMVAAVAEGDLLILTFEAAPTALAGMTPLDISTRLSEGFCSHPAARALLDGPMSLRADARVPGGEFMRGEVIETCPPAAAASPAGR